jgi:hypothetical protein
MSSQVSLHPHAATPCAYASTLTVRVDWITDDRLVLNYRIEGDVDALYLPARQSSARKDGLWRSTCFEVFIRPPGARGYVEFNVSPSTEWAIYRFDDYRRGMRALAPKQPPKIFCRRREGELDADIEIHLATLGLPAGGDLELGLAAVLQDRSAALCCWALAHPAVKPDFHDPAGFLLTLSRPASGDRSHDPSAQPPA